MPTWIRFHLTPLASVVRTGIIRTLPIAIYLAASAAFIQSRISLLEFPLDDAWIHRVYARALAFGHGFAYNPGQQEAGSTSPLWSILTAPPHWLEGFGVHGPILLVKAIGILLGLASVWILQSLVARLARSRAAGAIAASLFALEPRLLFSSFSGMETNLLLVLLIGAGLAWMKNKPWLLLLLVGLAPTVRPEAVLALPAAWAGMMAIGRSNRPLPVKLLAVVLPVLPLLAWSGFCWHATGHLLPNTFYVKAQAHVPSWLDVQIGVRAVAMHGTVPGWLFAAGAGAFGFLCAKNGKRSAAPVLFLVVLPILYVAGVVLSRSIFLSGYYWTRWIDPGALLLSAASCAGFAYLLAPSVSVAEAAPGRPAFKSSVQYGLRWALFALFWIPAFSASFAERRNRLVSDSRAIAILNVQMGKWIAIHTPRDAVVGVNDAGAIRYFGQRRTVDLVGLNNADVAFGKLSFDEAVSRCDWLAVFPSWFPAELFKEYDLRFETWVPPEEYTICNAPQNWMVAAERK